MTRLRIGLLGGSFNPAHEGHVHVSLEALKRLKLDAVWWLVSPGNPLKVAKDMASYAKRFASARKITQSRRNIVISDFEHKRGLHYTYASLRTLKRLYPRAKFVWLMGADNLHNFHRWQHWREIARTMPIAVFDRAPFSHKALHAKAAIALKTRRMRDSEIGLLADCSGYWAYILMRRHPASSTEIRSQARIPL